MATPGLYAEYTSFGVQRLRPISLTLKISGEHEMDDLDTLLISSAGS
jgi:hypothetical protein